MPCFLGRATDTFRPPPYFSRAVRDVFAGNEGEFMGHPPPHKWAWGLAEWGEQRLSARGGGEQLLNQQADGGSKNFSQGR